MKRLVALAQALSADGVRPGALAEVERGAAPRPRLRYATRYSDKLEAAIEEVWAVAVKAISGRSARTG